MITAKELIELNGSASGKRKELMKIDLELALLQLKRRIVDNGERKQGEATGLDPLSLRGLSKTDAQDIKDLITDLGYELRPITDASMLHYSAESDRYEIIW